MSQLHVCISPRRAPSKTSSGSFSPTEALPQETPTPAAAGWTSGSCSTSSEGRGPLPVGSHKKSTEVQVMPQASLCLPWALGRTDRCVVQRQAWTHRRREGKCSGPQTGWLAVPPTTSLHQARVFPSMPLACVCLRMESLPGFLLYQKLPHRLSSLHIAFPHLL